MQRKSVNLLKVVAADSGAAVLNDNFEPLLVVATAVVLVEPPFQKASFFLAKPVFSKVEQGYLLVVNELEFCQKVLKEIKADVVHLDMSMGGSSVEELSVTELSRMRISSRARKQVLKILPKIRKIAADIKRLYGIEVVAIGKDSIPVRIAELMSGAHAILYSAEKAIKEKRQIRLGLPARCQANRSTEGIVLQSLIPAEHDIAGYAKDEQKILERVKIAKMHNPCARGFRALEITPKT